MQKALRFIADKKSDTRVSAVLDIILKNLKLLNLQKSTAF